MSDGLRVDSIPGVGPRYELGTVDGRRLTVVIDHLGDRHISLRPGGQVDDPGATAVLSTRQSSLVALILTGAFELAEPELSDVMALAGAEYAAR